MSRPPRFWFQGLPEPFGARVRNDERYRQAQALVKAAQANDVACIADLAAAGAPVDLVLWGSGTSLLAHSLSNGRREAARALLAAGADPTFPARATSIDAAVVSRLDNTSHALDRAARKHDWERVGQMLGQVTWPEPAGSRMDWASLCTVMLVHGAPWPLLEGLLATLKAQSIAPPSPANLLATAASMASAPPGLVDRLLDRCLRPRRSRGIPPGLQVAQPPEPDPDAWAKVVDDALEDALPMEFSSSQSAPRLPQGRVLGHIIARWHARVAPEDPALAHARVKQWATSAALRGHAPLLRRTLLPLLPSSRVGQGLLGSLLPAVLESHVRVPETLAVLAHHFGQARVDAAWRQLDVPPGLAWGKWLSRPGLAQDAGTLELARALVDAGVPLPDPPGRSWLEDCFSTGLNVLVRFGPHRGVALLALLVDHGADPFRMNLSGQTPAQKLDALPPDAFGLDLARRFLQARRLDTALPPSSPARPPAPRL